MPSASELAENHIIIVVNFAHMYSLIVVLPSWLSSDSPKSWKSQDTTEDSTWNSTSSCKFECGRGLAGRTGDGYSMS